MSDNTTDTSHKAKVRLTGLKSKEVSLVDRPAIEEEFNVRKNKGESAMPNAVKPESGSTDNEKVTKAGEAHAALVDEKIEAIVKLANELAAAAPTALKLDWGTDERKDFMSKMWDMEDLIWQTSSPAAVVATLSKRLTTAVDVLQKSNEEAEATLNEAAEVAKSVVATIGKACATDDETKKATWTAAYINTLPDSSFLYIESGGEKDEEGKTTPRSLRHFPVKDENGKVDLPHVRNALARIPQSNVPQDAKDKATAAAEKLLAAATEEEKGADMAEDTKKTEPEAAAAPKGEDVAKKADTKPADSTPTPTTPTPTDEVKKGADDTKATKEEVAEIKKSVDELGTKFDAVMKKLDEVAGTKAPSNADTVPDGNAAPVNKAENIWGDTI